MSEEELILEMYKVQVARSEHFEDLRTSISNILLAINAALIGYASSEIIDLTRIKIVSSTIILAGVFGLFASTLHSRRAQRHGLRAQAYREALAVLFPTFLRAYETVPKSKTHLNLLWASLHIGIISIGIGLFIYGLSGDA